MKETVFNWLASLGLNVTPLLSWVVAVSFIATISAALHMVLHRVLLVKLVGLLGKAKRSWLPLALQQRLFYRLAFVLQGIVLLAQAEIWLKHGSSSLEILYLVGQLWILLFMLLALFAFLDCVLSVSSHTQHSRSLPLKGIFQGVKLIASLMIGITMTALLLGKSPLYLFSGLGAMTAVLMLVFKDPILGLVAGIQLSANRMLHVGDWLQMDKHNADGEVSDIGLTTVKVSNWDKTTTTIPTYLLISDSFKNWQGMIDAGGRRIKRSFNIDMTSVRFLTVAEQDALKQAKLLAGYLQQKQQELTDFNLTQAGAVGHPINGRFLTNLGTLRAYLDAYLRAHPAIRNDMTLMVRQLSPTEHGLPLEVYCFTVTTALTEYEAIQADIFDHICAIVEQFHLRLHQSPTGYDLRGHSGARA
ncbi:MAG: mechanosensitive ion channel family protein [Aeromonas sp.]